MKQHQGVWITSEALSYYDKMEHGIYNKELFDLSMKHIKNWGVAIDLGTHVGTWTKAILDKFSYVYGFEMNKELSEITLKNCEGKNKHKLSMINQPVMHTNVWVGIEKLSCTMSDHITLAEIGDKEAVYLDQFKYPKKVGFIKMNIEGAEPFALMGAVLTILRDKPVITLEHKYEDRFGFKQGFCESFLNGIGYKKIIGSKAADIYI